MVKVLVADDSPTIQKVITITLGNEPYELGHAHNEKDLIQKLKTEKYDLVLLDYNLNESKSGIDLAREIKEISSNTKILALVGTFETVSLSELKNGGIEDFIAKPFESEKFINKCKTVLESTSNNEIQLEQNIAELDSDEELSDWTLSEKTSTIQELDSDDDIQISEDKKFESDLAEWGVQEGNPVLELDANDLDVQEVPPVISENQPAKPKNTITQESTGQFDVSEFLSSSVQSDGEQILPSQRDLEYPNFDLEEPLEIETSSPKSKLISLEELAPDNEQEDPDSTDPSYELPENRIDLQKELEADIDPDNFWAIDEESEKSTKSGPEVVSSVDINEETLKVKPTVQKNSDELVIENHGKRTEVAHSSPAPVSNSTLSDQQLEMLVQKLLPLLDDKIRQYCKEVVEKVAWEVVPDLAENLIRKELSEIAVQVVTQELRADHS